MAWNPAPTWATWLSATPDAGSVLSLTSASSQTATRPAPPKSARLRSRNAMKPGSSASGRGRRRSRTASGAPLDPRSVEDKAAALISVLSSGSWQAARVFTGVFRLVVLHVQERMPVSRASPASLASEPAQPGTEPGPAGAGDDELTVAGDDDEDRPAVAREAAGVGASADP